MQIFSFITVLVRIGLFTSHKFSFLCTKRNQFPHDPVWAHHKQPQWLKLTQHTCRVHKVRCSVWKSRNFTSDYLICIWLLDLPHITPTGIYVDAPALGTGQYMLCYLWRGWCQLRYRQGGFTCLRQCIITTEYRVKISDFGRDTTLFWGNISLARPGFD
jgi:hypothetical protein